MKLIAQLSESKLYPSSTKLDKEQHGTLTKQAHMLFMALYILLCEESTREWAEKYISKTLRGDFKSWRTDSTDLYAIIYALHTGKYDSGHYRVFSITTIKKWLRDVEHFKKADDAQINVFLFRLDTLFDIKDSSQRSIRRNIMKWYELKNSERKVYFTKLLYLFRHEAAKSEIVPKLEELAKNKKYEIDENAHQEKQNFLKELETLEEDASAGATGAASVATCAKPLGGETIGAGFDANGHKGIYQGAKPLVIRRNPTK